MSRTTGALRVLAQVVSAGVLLVGSSSSVPTNPRPIRMRTTITMMEAPPPVNAQPANYTCPTLRWCVRTARR